MYFPPHPPPEATAAAPVISTGNTSAAAAPRQSQRRVRIRTYGFRLLDADSPTYKIDCRIGLSDPQRRRGVEKLHDGRWYTIQERLMRKRRFQRIVSEVSMHY